MRGNNVKCNTGIIYSLILDFSFISLRGINRRSEQCFLGHSTFRLDHLSGLLHFWPHTHTHTRAMAALSGSYWHQLVTHLFASGAQKMRSGVKALCFWRRNLERKNETAVEYFMAGNRRRHQCNSCKTSSSSRFIWKDQKIKKNKEKHLRAKQRNSEYWFGSATSEADQSCSSLWLSLVVHTYTV